MVIGKIKKQITGILAAAMIFMSVPMPVSAAEDATDMMRETAAETVQEEEIAEEQMPAAETNAEDENEIRTEKTQSEMAAEISAEEKTGVSETENSVAETVTSASVYAKEEGTDESATDAAGTNGSAVEGQGSEGEAADEIFESGMPTDAEEITGEDEKARARNADCNARKAHTDRRRGLHCYIR